jgi:hypothetical protein
MKIKRRTQMINFRTGAVSAVVLIMVALRCASVFAVEPDAAQSPKKGENTAKSDTKPPELTRDYLLANGFKQSPKDADSFAAEHMGLKDAARILGFAIGSLHRRESSDAVIRVGFVQGKRLVVRSETKGAKGNFIWRSAKRPDIVCTVEISLKKYVQPPPPLKTDSNPRVTVKSVVVPKDRTKPLRVTYEIAAEGKLPVGLLFNQVGVRLTLGNSVLCETVGPFSDGCEEFIYLIKPGAPRSFTVTVPDDSTLDDGDWDGFHPGKDTYAVQAVIDGQSVLRADAFDYSWVNGRPRRDCKVESKKFEFTVK